MIPAVARWYQAASGYTPADPRDRARMLAVTFTLGQLADYWTGVVCASTTEIAGRCGIGRNTAARLLAELTAAGLLRLDKRHGNRRAPVRSLTIGNCSAPVQSARRSRGANCTSAVHSKEAKEGSSEYNSTYASHVRARERGNVVHLDTRRGELGMLLAETRGRLRSARERGPHRAQ